MQLQSRVMNPSVPLPAASPAGCDCHVHIYENGYPILPRVAWLPVHSPVSRYRREVQQPLGLAHAVLVQPTAYGFDNSCMLDALDQFGGRARGIALLDPQASDDHIAQLHARGVRGARYMLIDGLLDWDSLAPMSARLAARGWMINLQFDGRTAAQREDLIRRLPSTVVIDHTCKFLRPVPPSDPAFQALLRILDSGRVWIKLSAPYETSRSGPPGYDDVGVLAGELARRFPERCLWASNWPHPSQNPPPSDRSLLDWLRQWVPDGQAQQRILTDNPAALYGFNAPALP